MSLTIVPKADAREDAQQRLRNAGLRATSARMAVLQILTQSDAPLSHGEVSERLDAELWDRATIYRNLMDLVRAGLAQRSDSGDHIWRFELEKIHHDPAQHPHFVCTTCGTVECLPEMEMLPAEAVSLPRAVQKHRVEVQVKGVCDDCDLE